MDCSKWYLPVCRLLGPSRAYLNISISSITNSSVFVDILLLRGNFDLFLFEIDANLFRLASIGQIMQMEMRSPPALPSYQAKEFSRYQVVSLRLSNSPRMTRPPHIVPM